MPDVRYAAFGGTLDDFGLLGAAAVDQWEEISAYQSKTWKVEAERKRLDRMRGCLDKLTATLQQVHRLRIHHDELLTLGAQVSEQAHAVAALRGALYLADFECLLLQARSVLDRVTWLVSAELRQSTSSFRKLRKVLEGAPKNNPLATRLLPIVDAASPWIYQVLAESAEHEALRDLVGHKHAASEGVLNCFSVANAGPRAFLAFDCELRLPRGPARTAVFQTAHESAQFVPYFVLNTLSILSGAPERTEAEFSPCWELKTVAPSRYAVDLPPDAPMTDHSILMVQRTTPDGFEVKRMRFAPELWQHAVRTAPVAP